MKIKSEYIGKTVAITDNNGLLYSGKVVELESSEDTESGEVEMGINYAGGITMFPESKIEKISIVE